MASRFPGDVLVAVEHVSASERTNLLGVGCSPSTRMRHHVSLAEVGVRAAVGADRARGALFDACLLVPLAFAFGFAMGPPRRRYADCPAGVNERGCPVPGASDLLSAPPLVSAVA